MSSTTDALAAYEDAARYYAGCQEGLELDFIAAVEHAVRQILEARERWRIREEDIRRCLTSVFPYAVLYTIERDYVLIYCGYALHQFDILSGSQSVNPPL